MTNDLKTPGLRTAKLASAGCLVVLFLFLAGCSRGPDAEQVRNVRLGGQPDSARVMALYLLSENADRMPIWLEFVRSSLDAVRLRPNEESHADDLETLTQASLVCSAVYEKSKHEPPRDWRDIGKLLSAEVARQISGQLTSMTVQMQSANTLKTMLNPVGPDSMVPHGPEIRAAQMLSDYRTGARHFLFWGVVLRRLLESLPEVNPGTVSLLAGQQDESFTAWAQTLDLDPAYVKGTQQQARQAIDQAMNHALQDYRDLGYFLPQTITENGVSP